MPDKSHEPMNLPPPALTVGRPEAPPASLVDEDELARQELARIMPSKATLLDLAAKCGPLPKWLDEDEDPPF